MRAVSGATVTLAGAVLKGAGSVGMDLCYAANRLSPSAEVVMSFGGLLTACGAVVWTIGLLSKSDRAPGP